MLTMFTADQKMYQQIIQAGNRLWPLFIAGVLKVSVSM